jgi:hypothetical protein
MVDKQKTLTLFLALIVLIGSLLYSFRDTNISLATKNSFFVILKKNPEINHFRTSLKFYDEIELQAQGYSNNFVIQNFEYKASRYNNIVNDLKIGDTITIWVDYKFAPNKKNVAVYNLRYKGNDYVNIKLRNSIKSRYNKYGLVVAFYGLFLLFNIYGKRYVSLSFEKAILILLLMAVGIYRITK